MLMVRNDSELVSDIGWCSWKVHECLRPFNRDNPTPTEVLAASERFFANPTVFNWEHFVNTYGVLVGGFPWGV